MRSAPPQVKLQGYAQAFEEAKGTPRARVRALARRFGVQETSVRVGLLRIWGRDRFEEVFRSHHLGHSLHEYVSTYDKLRGAHEDRVRAIAKDFKVQEQAVVAALKHAWGMAKWQRRLGKSRRTKVAEYAEAFESMKGDSHQRILNLSRRHNVKPETMKKALQRHWGTERFRRLVP